MTRRIDLSCDVGEASDPRGQLREAALLDWVSSVNVACGGHAGDTGSMRSITSRALRSGIAVGAHPSYPDREGFGRRASGAGPSAVEAWVREQVDALARILDRGGDPPLAHVKPHGALYHAAIEQPPIAAAIASGTLGCAPSPPILVCAAGSRALTVWRALGRATAAEAFADRCYERDGTLRPRSRPGALILDPGRAAEQAVRIARGAGVLAGDGSVVLLAADTIGIHGDTPGAAALARAVRQGLEVEGFRICSVQQR